MLEADGISRADDGIGESRSVDLAGKDGVHDAASSSFDMAELAALLDALPDDGWIVDRTLSKSDYEMTQIVHRGTGSEDKKFVRKVFSRDTGLGVAYRRVLAAQVQGQRFTHLPFVYDVAETEEGVVVISEFVQGQTLRQYVEARGPSLEIALAVGLELCDAMGELHESFDAPIVHRDLKPTNIMIAGGKIVLIDLGIARAYRAGVTHDTMRFGTPGYAPPEQFGYGQTTPQSDIYAAGMVIAYCLTGEEPTPALRESGFADSRIPEALRPVLAKATSLDVMQRFPTARDMKDALEKSVAWQEPRSASVSNSPSPDSIGNLPKSSTSSPGTSHHVVILDANAPSAQDAPSSATGLRGRPFLSRIPDKVGVAWNVVLCIMWSLLTVLAIFTSITGGTEFLDRIPMWLRFVEYFGLFVIPGALLVVLLADKRRLRNRIPLLAKLTGWRLLALCLGLIVVLYFAMIAFYYAVL